MKSRRVARSERGLARVYEDKRYRTWRVQFYFEGHLYTSQSCKRRCDAETLAARANGVLPLLRADLVSPPDRGFRDFVFSGGHTDDSADALSDERTAITFQQLVEKYRDYAKPPTKAENTCKTEGFHLEHLLRFLRRTKRTLLLVDQATAELFEDYKRFRISERRKGKKNVSPFTVNKELITIRNVLSYGVGIGCLTRDALGTIKRFPKVEVERPPFATGAEIEEKIKKGAFTPEEQRALRRARILTWEEIGQLLEILRGSPSFVPVAVAAHTGARRGEIARLTWADVSLDSPMPEIALRSKKQSRVVRETTRRVNVAPTLLPILRDYQNMTGGTGYLFLGEADGTHTLPETLSNDLKRTVRGSSFSLVMYHNLRHSFESNLARAGVDQREINELMGHTNDETARRYRHLFPDQRRRWMGLVYGNEKASAAKVS